MAAGVAVLLVIDELFSNSVVARRSLSTSGINSLTRCPAATEYQQLQYSLNKLEWNDAWPTE